MLSPMAQRQAWWRVAKAAVTLAILAGVGWQFVRILQAPELQGTEGSRTPAQILWDQVRQARPGWLAASGALYLAGLGFPAFYWARLQRHLGQQLPGPVAVCRAYYVSHLGKYLPGKAWALVLRATLIGGPGVRVGVAGMAAFYEVLTSMTGGALFAAVLFAVLVPDRGALPDWSTIKALFTLRLTDTAALDREVLIVLALLVALPVGLPILPPLFNRLVYRLTTPFRQADADDGGVSRDFAASSGMDLGVVGSAYGFLRRGIRRQLPDLRGAGKHRRTRILLDVVPGPRDRHRRGTGHRAGSRRGGRVSLGVTIDLDCGRAADFGDAVLAAC
jgi:hypothetical protein